MRDHAKETELLDKETTTTLLEQGGIWTGIIAGLTGLIGWRIGAAKDSVVLQYHGKQINEIEKQLSALSKSQTDSDRETATALAKLNVTLESMSSIMTKLEKRLSDVEHDPPRRPSDD